MNIKTALRLGYTIVTDTAEDARVIYYGAKAVGINVSQDDIEEMIALKNHPENDGKLYHFYIKDNYKGMIAMATFCDDGTNIRIKYSAKVEPSKLQFESSGNKDQYFLNKKDCKTIAIGFTWLDKNQEWEGRFITPEGKRYKSLLKTEWLQLSRFEYELIEPLEVGDYVVDYEGKVGRIWSLGIKPKKTIRDIYEIDVEYLNTDCTMTMDRRLLTRITKSNAKEVLSSLVK